MDLYVVESFAYLVVWLKLLFVVDKGPCSAVRKRIQLKKEVPLQAPSRVANAVEIDQFDNTPKSVHDVQLRIDVD